MSKLTTKQKVALFVSLGIVAEILTIAAFVFFIYLTMFHVDYGKMYNFYSTTDGYEYFDITVSKVKMYEDHAYIDIDSIDTDDYHSRYADKYKRDVRTNFPYFFYRTSIQITGKTFDTLLESGFFDKVQEGTVLTIYSHPEYWWNGWDYPLIAVSIGDEVYLDFETGKQNWLDWLKCQYEDYRFLQTPIKEQP